MKKNAYHCYSLPLMKYLHANNHIPTHITVHRTTKRTIWIYDMSDELNELLQQWTKNKK